MYPAMPSRPLFSGRNNSSDESIRLPSQPPFAPCALFQEPHSWKMSLIAARASGLHSPFDRNFAVSSFEMSFHFEGQLLPLVWRENNGRMAETSDNENAAADEAKRRRLEGYIMTEGYESKSPG